MIRAAIAHQSKEVINQLSSTISNTDEIEIVCRVKDATRFFKKIENTQPDVVLIGTEFNGLSGLDLIHELTETYPTPVLVIKEEDNIDSVKAFSYGAIDIISPHQGLEETESLIKMASKVEDFNWLESKPAGSPKSSGESAICIGASTGGPGSLETVISSLPANISSPIFVAQHMSTNCIQGFAERLNEISSLEVKKAEDGEEPGENTVYISPADKDMIINEENEKPIIKLEEPSRKLSPSIDRLFESIAEVYGDKSVAIVLSGMGKDGALGGRYLDSAGSTLIVQDEKTSTVNGIGSHVRDQGNADKVLPLSKIPKEAVRCL